MRPLHGLLVILALSGPVAVTGCGLMVPTEEDVKEQRYSVGEAIEIAATAAAQKALATAPQAGTPITLPFFLLGIGGAAAAAYAGARTSGAKPGQKLTTPPVTPPTPPSTGFTGAVP